VFLGLFSAILGVRIVLALQVPSDSSEVLRHLGFTAHLGELGFRFYTATPRDFRPEPWTSVWTNRPYNCPPLALAFFALFSSWGLGIAWVKLALTFADAGTALLFRRDLSPWGSLLFFASPVAMFYGSHEGQLEPLQTLFIVLAAAATRREKWFRSGLLFLLSVQVKVFGALLAPWIASRLLTRGNRSDLVRFSAGCLVGVLPFAGFYWVSPGAIWASVWSRGPDSFNPFWWNPFDSVHRDWMPAWLFVWMSIVTSTMLSLAVCSALRRLWSGERPWDHVPFVSFWSVLKLVDLTALYYAIVGNAFAFCLVERRALAHALLALQLLACPRSALLLAGRPPFGHAESAASQALLAQCLWTCDLRAPRRTASRRAGLSRLVHTPRPPRHGVQQVRGHCLRSAAVPFDRRVNRVAPERLGALTGALLERLQQVENVEAVLLRHPRHPGVFFPVRVGLLREDDQGEDDDEDLESPLSRQPGELTHRFLDGVTTNEVGRPGTSSGHTIAHEPIERAAIEQRMPQQTADAALATLGLQ